MGRILRGKFLVRKAKLKDGTQALTISGVFHPLNFDISDVSDSDEMWVSEIKVYAGGAKFSDPLTIDGGSPEEFLEGKNQLPDNWKTRGSL